MAQVIKSPKDSRDYSLKTTLSNLPKTFALDMGRVKSQGATSTCVAHALATVIEYHNYKQQGIFSEYSTEFIYGYKEPDYYTGEGMVVRQALNTILKHGDPYLKDCPGNHNKAAAQTHVMANRHSLTTLGYPHRISGYAKLENSEEIKTALIKYGPVICTID